jgi:two-component sensor histidine kinase
MTDVALREYLERRIEDLDRRITDRFALSDAAVIKAERTMNDRLDSMNEFRDALKDQASRMATREELETVDRMVQELRRAQANLDGRLVILAGTVSLITAIAVSLIMVWR